jgi:hypothetical protein
MQMFMYVEYFKVEDVSDETWKTLMNWLYRFERILNEEWIEEEEDVRVRFWSSSISWVIYDV